MYMLWNGTRGLLMPERRQLALSWENSIEQRIRTRLLITTAWRLEGAMNQPTQDYANHKRTYMNDLGDAQRCRPLFLYSPEKLR